MCSASTMHVLIIGAGMAGVGTGVVAVRAGHTVTLVDRRATVGGLWTPGGHYPQARLQEDGSQYSIPGHRIPSSVEGLPAATDIADYVRSVATRGGLRSEHFRLSTAVTSMSWVAGDVGEREGGGGVGGMGNGGGADGGWKVTLVPVDTDDAAEEVVRVDWVVVATGREGGSPTDMPVVRNAGAFRGRILTDRDTYGMDVEELLAATGVSPTPVIVRSRVEQAATGHDKQEGATTSTAPARSVVIAGNGKTAMDLALSLTDLDGVTAHLVASRRHWMMPYKFLGFLPSLPLLYMRAAGVASPCWAYTTPIARALAGPLWPLAWLYGIFLAAVVRASVGWHRDLDGGGADFERDSFRNSFCMIPTGFRSRLLSGRIVMHAPDEVVEAASEATLRLASGKVLPATALLSCRGCDHRSSLAAFLPAADIDALFAAGDGLSLYRHMVHPDVAPHVAFVAAQHAFGRGTTIHMQALWLVELWAGRLVLPSRKEQRDEMNRVARVKREQLSCNREPASVVMDRFYPYLDELCMDLGVDPMRGKGLAGYFHPFNPDWYADVEGELRRRGGNT